MVPLQRVYGRSTTLRVRILESPRIPISSLGIYVLPVREDEREFRVKVDTRGVRERVREEGVERGELLHTGGEVLG